jgi:hypothetical protein
MTFPRCGRSRMARRRTKAAWWMSYSRYRTVRRGRLWAVVAENGDLMRRYPAHRYDRAQAFSDKLNHEEWEMAFKASRPKRKVKKRG